MSSREEFKSWEVIIMITGVFEARCTFFYKKYVKLETLFLQNYK